MAVQAQYPANVLLLNRGETERKNKEMETNFSHPLLEQSPVFLTPNGGNVNSRKRGREAAVTVPLALVSPQPMSLLSLQAPAGGLTPAMLGLVQFQSSPPSLVSTGLRLTFDDQIQSQNQKEQTDSILSSFSKDLAAEINQQKQEIEQFLITQGEQLRREMAEKRQHTTGICSRRWRNRWEIGFGRRKPRSSSPPAEPPISKTDSPVSARNPWLGRRRPWQSKRPPRLYTPSFSKSPPPPRRRPPEKTATASRRPRTRGLPTLTRTGLTSRTGPAGPATRGRPQSFSSLAAISAFAPHATPPVQPMPVAPHAGVSAPEAFKSLSSKTNNKK